VVVAGLFLLDSESRLQLGETGAGAKSSAALRANVDPVCGMDVDPAKAAYKSEYEGTTYLFCTKDCKTKFDAQPSRFVRKGPGPKGGQS
jgi:Cu+-exporting ATPase